MELSLQVLKVSDEVYHANWYEIPIKYQKVIPLIIAMNRKPRYFTGCKLITANRKTFKEVRDFYFPLR